MQYLPHVPNSHGYVGVRIVQQIWKDRILWVFQNEEYPIFPLIIHPDTSGMAHVIAASMGATCRVLPSAGGRRGFPSPAPGIWRDGESLNLSIEQCDSEFGQQFSLALTVEVSHQLQ